MVRFLLWVVVLALTTCEATAGAFAATRTVWITNTVEVQIFTDITNYHQETVDITNSTWVEITNIIDITNTTTVTNSWDITNTITELHPYRSIAGAGLGYRFGTGLQVSALYGYQVLDFLPLYLGASLSVDTTATLSAVALWKF